MLRSAISHIDCQDLRDKPLQYGPRCIDLPAPHEGQQVKVVNIRDLTVGYDESTPDHIPVSDEHEVKVTSAVCNTRTSAF